MAEGRQRAGWDQTSALLAQLANVGCYLLAKKPKVYNPADFNPTVKRKAKAKRTAADKLQMLKFMFTKAK